MNDRLYGARESTYVLYGVWGWALSGVQASGLCPIEAKTIYFVNLVLNVCVLQR